MLMGLCSELHVGSDLCLAFIHPLLLIPKKRGTKNRQLDAAVPIPKRAAFSISSGVV